MRGRPAPLAERFSAKVDKSGQCWEWMASKARNGYGQIGSGGSGGTMLLAHRVAYELAKGPIPAGLVIDHTCHNKACVNPAHLRAITQKQNVENRAGAQSNSRLGIRGVRKRTLGRWEARVHHAGTTHYLGLFTSPEEAEAAVIAKRNELFTCNDMDRVAS